MSEEKKQPENDELDVVINKIEKEQADADAKEGEVIQKAEDDEAKQRYEAALENGYRVMGIMRAGIGKLWPYVSFGEGEDAEKQFIEDGAHRHAEVLQKYDVPDAPGWVTEYMPEIKLGLFYGTIGFSMYLQVRAHKAAEDAQQQTEGDQHGQESESSAP